MRATMAVDQCRNTIYRRPLSLPLLVLLFLVLQSTVARCYQFKVGDLDAWGIPTSAKPQVYVLWAKNHVIKIGDSLLFLYPPSQDSVVQVTAAAFDSCNVTDPILHLSDGNSLFNISSDGNYYFTSGVAGRCQKKQKLHIAVGNGTGDSSPESSASSEIAPSYQNVFGSIPAAPSASAVGRFTVAVAAAVVLAVYLAIGGSI